MKNIVLSLLTFLTSLFSFTFVVLGDRTERADDEVFKKIIIEIKILKPDFIINTGDLIEGDKKDSLAIIKEWEKVLKMLKDSNTKIYFTPGEQDIYSQLSQKIYLSLIGKTWYSFSYNNAHFIVLDNSRYRSFEETPLEMVDWLERDLQAHKKYKWKFVFFHRPFWRYEYEKKRLKNFLLHQIFKRYKVNYVFSGHDHFYAYLFYDSIHYFQVGPSGAKYKINSEENVFHNYLLLKVDKDEVDVCVIKPGSIFSKEKVLLEKTLSRERFKKEGVKLSAFLFGEEKGEDTVFLHIVNPLLKKIKGKFFWQYSENYSFDSEKGNFLLESKGEGKYQFIVKIKNPYQIYPLPNLHLYFNYDYEKDSLIFILPVTKEIRLKKGELYPIEDFCKTDGNEANLNIKIFINHDQENLYLNFSDKDFYQFDSLFLYFAKTNDSIMEIMLTKEKKLFFSRIRPLKEGIKKVRQREKKWLEEIKAPLKEIVFENYTYFNIKFYKGKEVFYLKIPFDFDVKDWYKIYFDK